MMLCRLALAITLCLLPNAIPANAQSFGWSRTGTYELFGTGVDVTGEFDASLITQNGEFDLVGLATGQKSLTSYWSDGGRATGRVAVSAINHHLGISVFADVSTYKAIHGAPTAFADISFQNSYRMEWNHSEPMPIIGNTDYLRFLFKATAAGRLDIRPEDGVNPLEQRAEGYVSWRIGAASDGLNSTISAATGGFIDNVSLGYEQTIHHNGAREGSYSIGLNGLIRAFEKARGIFTSGHSLSLERIEFPDGTTPESHGFDIVFASGAISPNLLSNVNLGADFDVDGDVDGGDFLAWQRGAGLDGEAFRMDGDADEDHDVDGADLVAWKSEFGQSIQALIAPITAPEPGAGAMLLFAFLTVAVLRSTRGG